MELDVARILRALRRGDFIRTHHARVRMKERGINVDDICSVGRTSIEVTAQGNSIYKVVGLDMDSEQLTVIATYEAGVVVITVY